MRPHFTRVFGIVAAAQEDRLTIYAAAPTSEVMLADLRANGAIATCSAEGVPNVTALSQVFFVDDGHVALSQQFFSKTKANLLGNPFAVVQLIHPETAVMWILDLRFLRSESEGALFDAMEMQL